MINSSFASSNSFSKYRSPQIFSASLLNRVPGSASTYPLSTSSRGTI